MINHNKKKYAIGVDLGGTKIDIGLVDSDGNIISQERLKTQVKEGAKAIENQILQSIHTLMKAHDVPLVGVGIGVPGQVEAHTGVVTFAPNLQWHQYPLKENIEKALHLPTHVLNDVRAISLGEWRFAAGKGTKDLLCVFIGTGIGGGIVSEGRLLSGFSNTLGEVGHMTIDFRGPLCTCGNRGCFEAYAGGWGIAARARDAIESDNLGKRSQCILQLAEGNIKSVTAKNVVEAYRQGDPLAVELIQNVKQALIAGLSSLVNIFNPDILVLGGGFTEGLPEIVPDCAQGIKNTALKAATHSLKVLKSEIGKGGGIIGPAAAIFQEESE